MFFIFSSHKMPIMEQNKQVSSGFWLLESRCMCGHNIFDDIRELVLE